MTKPEIDELKYDRRGAQEGRTLPGLLSDFEDSVNFMQTGEVVIQSMWSPAVTLLQGQFPVRYAAPKEGFRGWGGGMFHLEARRRDPDKLAAAYDYISWMDYGGAGGDRWRRQAYYNANIASGTRASPASR